MGMDVGRSVSYTHLDVYKRQTKYDGLVNSLRECYEVVRTNRAELQVPDKSDRGVQAEFGNDQV